MHAEMSKSYVDSPVAECADNVGVGVESIEVKIERPVLVVIVQIVLVRNDRKRQGQPE